MQISSFGSKKLAPCKNFSWLLTFKTGTWKWHLAIFPAPTFWEPDSEQPLGLSPIFIARILKATVIYKIYMKFIININLFDRIRNHNHAFKYHFVLLDSSLFWTRFRDTHMATNPLTLFSLSQLWRALWRPTAPASRTAEESRTTCHHGLDSNNE